MSRCPARHRRRNACPRANAPSARLVSGTRRGLGGRRLAQRMLDALSVRLLDLGEMRLLRLGVAMLRRAKRQEK